MSFDWKSLIPVAASFIPGVGPLIGAAAGGLLNANAGNKNAQISQQQQVMDQEFYKKQYADALRANRANQSNPWADMQWSQDDKGNWNQKVSLNSQDQARLDDWRSIAASRMGQAAKMDMSKVGGPIDYTAASKMYAAPNGGAPGSGAKEPFLNPYMSAIPPAASTAGGSLLSGGSAPGGMTSTTSMGGGALKPPAAPTGPGPDENGYYNAAAINNLGGQPAIGSPEWLAWMRTQMAMGQAGGQGSGSGDGGEGGGG